MSELSQDEVVAVLGPRVGAALVAEIIATGITKEELVLAYSRTVSDRKTHGGGPAIAPGHVGRVVEILERLRSQGLFGEAGSRLV
jgi:uncharacterized protein (DUF433 family)